MRTLYALIILSLPLAVHAFPFGDKPDIDVEVDNQVRIYDGDTSQKQRQGQKQQQKQKQYQEQGQRQKSQSRANAEASGGTAKQKQSAKAYSEGSKAGSKSYSGSDVYIQENDIDAAESAAALYSVGCQIGASGQKVEGGFSVILSDVVCDALKMADAHRVSLQNCGKPYIPKKPCSTCKKHQHPPVERPDLPTIEDVEQCKAFHHAKIHKFLLIAEDHIEDTEDTQEFAKNGINAGLGVFGIMITLLPFLLL